MNSYVSRLVDLAAILLLVGCGTTRLSKGGGDVRIVTEKERDCCCESIGMVTAAHSTGWTTKGDIESVYNRLRNETAARGGNAMRIVERNQQGNAWTGSTSSGVAEALRCDFDKIKRARE